MIAWWWCPVAFMGGTTVGYCTCAWFVAKRLLGVEKLSRQLRARMDEMGTASES